MTALAVFRQEKDGVIYAAPAEPDFTVRFKGVTTTKSLDGHRVSNHVEEIIINDDYSFTIGGDTVTDAISVRLRVSGATGSSLRKKAILVALISKLEGWADEGVMEGFPPQTAPTLPL